ncbi:MAG: molybdenum cofactor guanylyltransferase [Desulfuromonas sp.]|nr:molybdenum cofactor guanylyltransferase [Desulfuromonas sp.]
MDMHDFTTVLLAGGKSRRMGRDKLALVVAGKPLFERVLDALRPLAPEVLVITNDEQRFSHYAVTTYADIYPGSALGGLYTGLYYAQTEHVFASACDLPYANLTIAQYLCAVMGDNDVSVVCTSHGFEPLFACYSKRCLPAIEQALRSRNYKIQRIWNELQVKVVNYNEIAHIDGCASAFMNVNRQEDLDKIVQHPC